MQEFPKLNHVTPTMKLDYRSHINESAREYSTLLSEAESLAESSSLPGISSNKAK